MKKAQRDAIRSERLRVYAEQVGAWIRSIDQKSGGRIIPVLPIMLERVRDRFARRVLESYRIVWEERDLRGRLPAISWDDFRAGVEAFGGAWLKLNGGLTRGSVFSYWREYGDETQPERITTYLLGPLDPYCWTHLVDAEGLAPIGTDENRDIALKMHSRLWSALGRLDPIETSP